MFATKARSELLTINLSMKMNAQLIETWNMVNLQGGPVGLIFLIIALRLKKISITGPPDSDACMIPATFQPKFTPCQLVSNWREDELKKNV